jgi:hypothetical protein
MRLDAVSWIALGALAAGLVAGGALPSERLGPLTKDQILEACPDWQAVAAAYSPDPAALDNLRSLSREVAIEVFLGTWCSDSKDHVAEFFKVLELADTPLLRAVYVGVPEDGARRALYFHGLIIEKIPAFVVAVDGREVGRIVEHPKASVEADLVAILKN